MRPVKRTLLLLATSFSTAFALNADAASSANYQLGYAAFDAGGGVGSSTSYTLNASAIGTSLQASDLSNTNFAVIPGAQVVDDDGDGLDNAIEILVFATKTNDADTDDDLLTDGEEVMTILTDPSLFDTDGDTLGDGDEVANGWNPLDASDPGILNVPLPPWVMIIIGMLLVAIVRYRCSCRVADHYH